MPLNQSEVQFVCEVLGLITPAETKRLKALSNEEIDAKILNCEPDAYNAVCVARYAGLHCPSWFWVEELNRVFSQAIRNAKDAAEELDLIRRCEYHHPDFCEQLEFYKPKRIAALEYLVRPDNLDPRTKRQRPARSDLDKAVIAARNQGLSGEKMWAYVDDQNPQHKPQWRNPKFPWPGSFYKAYTAGAAAARISWKRRLNDYASKVTRRKSK